MKNPFYSSEAQFVYLTPSCLHSSISSLFLTLNHSPLSLSLHLSLYFFLSLLSRQSICFLVALVGFELELGTVMMRMMKRRRKRRMMKNHALFFAEVRLIWFCLHLFSPPPLWASCLSLPLCFSISSLLLLVYFEEEEEEEQGMEKMKNHVCF